MKAIIASPIKSGTHLAAAILARERGLVFTTVLFEPMRWHYYRNPRQPVAADGSLNIEQTGESIELAVPRVCREGHVYRTHVSPQYAALFRGFYVVTVERDLRECLVSYAFAFSRVLFGSEPIPFLRDALAGVRGTFLVRNWLEAQGWKAIADEVWRFRDLAAREDAPTFDTPTNSRGTTPSVEAVWDGDLEGKLQSILGREGAA